MASACPDGFNQLTDEWYFTTQMWSWTGSTLMLTNECCPRPIPRHRFGWVLCVNRSGIVTRGGLFFTHDPYWLTDPQYLWQKANEWGLATAEDLLSDTNVDRLLCAAGKESWFDRSEWRSCKCKLWWETDMTATTLVPSAAIVDDNLLLVPYLSAVSKGALESSESWFNEAALVGKRPDMRHFWVDEASCWIVCVRWNENGEPKKPTRSLPYLLSVNKAIAFFKCRKRTAEKFIGSWIRPRKVVSFTSLFTWDSNTSCAAALIVSNLAA
jgi:hypothetical protein